MKRVPAIILFVAIAVSTLSLTADEGMYPLSMIHKLDLGAKGLKIDIEEIYNPEGVSLVDAICEVGGGTGEFVSADGLILTNHHIAFSAVTAASTSENDYLNDGFVASTRDKEIPAQDYVCKITEGYEDVSGKILEGISSETPPLERNTLIAERMAKFAKDKMAGRNNIVCEVSEMYPGKSYILFTYRIIRDVRLVYVPPIAIGEFGGEFDNWVWPRHTGDFSFMRAYVAPDGSTASYSVDNVPFTPKKFLEVNPKGVDEGDFVMILGYPGRTYRHKTSYYIGMHNGYYLPFISEQFDWVIDRLEKAGHNNRDVQLKFADEIKSYANVTKNFKGKMQGLRRLQLVSKRAAEERELQAFIESDAALKIKYGSVLSGLDALYQELGSTVRQELTGRLLIRTCNTLRLSMIALAAARAEEMTDDRKASTIENLASTRASILVPVDKDILAHWILTALELPDDESIASIKNRFSNAKGPDARAAVESWVEDAFKTSVLFGENADDKLLNHPDNKALIAGGPLLSFTKELQADLQKVRKRTQERNGNLNKLEAELLDAKMMWKDSEFIPDANSTLRLTYGYIRGYAPADATYYSPITTLKGVIQKNTGKKPYNAPKELIDLYASKNYDKAFEAEGLEDVPVAILYNMDTTGGNSGSPILDAYGRLIGVNFDRAFEATINDYQWSEDYSRSIGVDIRYVLFIAKYLGGADFLLDELGVEV